MMRGLARPVSFLMAARCRRPQQAVGLLSQNHHVQVSAGRPAPAAGTNADNMGNLDERMCAHEATLPSLLSRTGRARAPGRDHNNSD